MMNMQSMMKQAQKLQKQMQVSQEEIANTTFVGKSAQDLVTVEFSGDRYKLSEYKETRLFTSNFFIVQKAMSATKKWSIKEG